MQTISSVTINSCRSLPTAADLKAFTEVYWNGANYIGVEPSDSLQSPLSAAITSGAGSISAITTTPFTISPSFFGMHHNAFAAGQNLPCSYGTWRFHDSNVQWSALETARGVINSTALAKLDAMLAKCASSSITPIYNVPFTPVWASSNSGSTGDGNGTGTAWCPASFVDLTNHVNYVLGRMLLAGVTSAYIEGWNEPDTPTCYKDTTANLVTHQQTIWNAVQAYNTANSTTHKVISPSYTDRGGVSTATYNLDSFLVAGGGSYFDVVGYHFYTGGQQGLLVDLLQVDMVKTVMANRGISGKELWCTECGQTYIANYANGTYNYFAQVLLYCAAKGVKRFCWYNWNGGGIGNMGAYQVPALWAAAVALLSGKTVQWVNVLPGNRLAASIGGVVQYV